MEELLKGGNMKHLKSINELFGLFNKKPNGKIDRDTIVDLVTSDLENDRFQQFNTLEHLKYDGSDYVKNRRGLPDIKRGYIKVPTLRTIGSKNPDIIFKERIKYIDTLDVSGVEPDGLVLSIDLGSLPNRQYPGMSLKESFEFINHIKNKLNKKRFNDYNIGFEFCKCSGSPEYRYNILFYNK